MKIHEVKYDSVALSLRRNELWQIHQMLLAIINGEGQSTDGISSAAFSIDSKIMAVVELMCKVDKET